ncbi:MAG: hypothetical protein GTO12_13930 [Proteobacteria bacterium]|nr:hypothetical protein [Pseudomonadota bacterium]
MELDIMAFPECGVDLCAFLTQGAYSEYYGSANLKNLCNLFAFYGFLEDAPNTSLSIEAIADFYRRQREE